MSKKSILIIIKNQFGYHTDYTKYCEYLNSEFNITYLCFDAGYEKLVMNNVNVKYIKVSGPKVFRGIRFLIACFMNIINNDKVVFIDYFEKCHLLKNLFPSKKMILNIRTLSVIPQKTIRVRQDLNLRKACAIFDHITPISIGVAKELRLSPKKFTIVPVGADNISITNKSFGSLRLLYVGSLNGRNIIHTILGLSYFIRKYPKIPISYDIIGDGTEVEQLNQIINELELSSIVKLHGRISHFKLKPFFDNSNIGISYIPMTEYFDFQPPTKTFEYILSGIPCIATKTNENKKLIKDVNGVLCCDNPESFSRGLEVVYKKRSSYDSKVIRESLKEYTWNKIVDQKLKPVINLFT